MRIDPVTLPEFGLSVNWAMCRNPMCANFGADLDVEIPEGQTQASSERYVFKYGVARSGEPTGIMTCRYCGQSSQLASNHAIRPIARYFLSLSLPFADCPDESCPHHGVNLFEHWAEKDSPWRRYYRRQRGEHLARCSAPGCGCTVSLGTALGVSRTSGTRRYWKEILQGLAVRRSVNDTFEETGVPIGSYYAHLGRIGARVRDYHSFRNAALLRPGMADRGEPVHVYTDVLEVSLKAYRHDARHATLSVIVSTLLADRKLFVLAAHPFFLPQELCPGPEDWRPDRGRPVCLQRWCSVHHRDKAINPAWDEDRRLQERPDSRRYGFFVSSPYAEVAHFLVVQKMLSRFDAIYSYMDGDKASLAAAVVAMRDRILAGDPQRQVDRDQRTRSLPRAEIALYQHDKNARQKASTPSRTRKPAKGLQEAWDATEEEFSKQAVPKDLLREAAGNKRDPRVRAALFRNAFKGGYSKSGGWAWLHYPADTEAYRRCRTLWVTRMPAKTFREHGSPCCRARCCSQRTR